MVDRKHYFGTINEAEYKGNNSRLDLFKGHNNNYVFISENAEHDIMTHFPLDIFAIKELRNALNDIIDTHNMTIAEIDKMIEKRGH